MATPTQIKAEEKAKELILFFKGILFESHLQNDQDPFNSELNDSAKQCALKLSEETLEAINSIKGKGKMHKVVYWKLIKENITNYAE